MEKDDKFLLSLAEDKMRQCDARCVPTFTPFLDLRQQSLVAAHCRSLRCTSFTFDGGLEDAERRICAFLPDYMQTEDLDVLRYLRVRTASALPSPLTHRDYLGALMGLGLRRETIGDILVRPDGADLIVLPEIADFLLSNFRSAGRASFQCVEIGRAELMPPAEQTQILRDTVPSLRLDCVLSAAFRLSRAAADAAIASGAVFCNGMQMIKPDRKVAPGDKLILRGSGKAVFRAVQGVSKKNRFFIEIEKYG